MARVYSRAGGRKLEQAMALTREAQVAIEDAALYGGAAAEGYLAAAKHRTGTSRIDVESGRIDKYVVLDDTRGLDAALTIEYGRKPGIDPETGQPFGGMPGLWVLHKAFPMMGKGKRPGKGGDSLVE